VELCVLFGSRATGGDRPDSDVDLAVWVVGRKASAEERLAWHRELTRLLGLPVQVVVVGTRLDPVLGLQIARQGHVLHANRDSVWPHERLRLWHLYQDSRPFLAAARHRLRRFAEEPHHGA
jgi:predicted nucleotidyltransferase